MATFVRVAAVGELPPGQVKQVVASGRKLALCNVGGEFFALDDRCTHEEQSLSEGDVEGDRLVCIYHAAAFNVRTGELEDGPRCANVLRFETRVNGADVEVAVE